MYTLLPTTPNAPYVAHLHQVLTLLLVSCQSHVLSSCESLPFCEVISLFLFVNERIPLLEGEKFVQIEECVEEVARHLAPGRRHADQDKRGMIQIRTGGEGLTV